jgi:hypothetical protein
MMQYDREQNAGVRRRSQSKSRRMRRLVVGLHGIDKARQLETRRQGDQGVDVVDLTGELQELAAPVLKRSAVPSCSTSRIGRVMACAP